MANISYGYNRKRPRTQIFLDASGLGAANTQSEKPLILIGSATGGKPHEPVELSNFSQAKEIFRGGELLDAIEMAWNPSMYTGGAGRLYAIRSDAAKQATLTDGAYTFTSRLYGADANGIQISLSDNVLTDSKRLGVYFTKERYERVYDNLGNIFSVQYEGDKAVATLEVTVDATTKLASQLILKVGDTDQNTTAVRTYDLGQGIYKDVNVLVNDINNLPDFKAQMNGASGSKTIYTQFLDKQAPVDVKTAPKMVKAIAADIANQLSTNPYVELQVDFTKQAPATIQVTNLSGGTTEPAPASWADLFKKVADLGAYYIVPLTSSEAIHAELSHFLSSESNSGDHLRAFVGGGYKETLGELQARQMNLRNPRVSVVGDSVVRRMSDGRVYNAPGYMYAALVGGIASGLPVGEPVTYKKVNVEALDTKFSDDQLDQLDATGVIMTEFVRNRTGSTFRIVSDPTTYNRVDEPVQNRVSLGEVSDFLTTELRTMLDDNFIGTRLRNTSASIIKNAIESFLDRQKNVNGLIVDYNPEDVQVVIVGNVATINVAVQPARGLDYINVYLTYEDNKLQA
ncbi:putative tail sheath protein [Bacillus phage vB_BceH_LY2]|nr:putative tail sheath protein [Bacillus phage vB_BceH_LY2]